MTEVCKAMYTGPTSGCTNPWPCPLPSHRCRAKATSLPPQEGRHGVMDGDGFDRLISASVWVGACFHLKNAGGNITSMRVFSCIKRRGCSGPCAVVASGNTGALGILQGPPVREQIMEDCRRPTRGQLTQPRGQLKRIQKKGSGHLLAA